MHGNHRVYSIDKKEYLHQLYWGDNLSYSQIAKLVGCSFNTVLDRMKKNNIEVRPFGTLGREPINKGKIGLPSWNKGLKGVQANTRKGKKYGPLSEEHKEKLRIANTGFRHTPETMLKFKGENNFKWKGDFVGYTALHTWVARELGKPKHCSICNDTSDHRYHWANVSGDYHRIKADWIRLCPKCHGDYDKNNKPAKDSFVVSKRQYSIRKGGGLFA